MLPMSQIMRKNQIAYHSYADDTQLYLALSPNDYSPIDSLCQCIDEVNSWMCQNFLQLNKDKTEVITFGNKDEVLKVETQKNVFGEPLIDLRKSGQMRQGLPLAFMHIVEFVEKHGLSQSGLFRVGGKVKLCQELRKGFDQGSFLEFDSGEIPTLASLLKLFLRELPGGLIPESHRTQLLKVFRDSKEEELNQAVRMILNSLPEEHFNILCYLILLNRMTSKNLSIVFGPTIFHVPLGPTMIGEQGLCNTLTEHLLNNLKHLLPNMYPHASTGNRAVSLYCVIRAFLAAGFTGNCFPVPGAFPTTTTAVSFSGTTGPFLVATSEATGLDSREPPLLSGSPPGSSPHLNQDCPPPPLAPPGPELESGMARLAQLAPPAELPPPCFCCWGPGPSWPSLTSGAPP
ncbi:unnamed protein product [Leuciscus chuanchicus]